MSREAFHAAKREETCSLLCALAPAGRVAMGRRVAPLGYVASARNAAIRRHPPDRRSRLRLSAAMRDRHAIISNLYSQGWALGLIRA